MNVSHIDAAPLEQRVQAHYTVNDLWQVLTEALGRAGHDPERLTAEDLAPVDEFHIRGREATSELAALVQPADGASVLDVGSGLGGTARYLASEHGCRVTGVDLTQAYCEVATELSRRLGLSDTTRFQQASALELPFPDDAFDIVWTEHVQMNIPDKARFYAEAARVLKPGGRLVFHDVFAGAAGPAFFPVPWSTSAELSFLAPVDAVRGMLIDLGMMTKVWIDSTARSRAFFETVVERLRSGAVPPVGLHLLMGASAKEKLENLWRSLTEERVVTVQAVLARGS